MVTGGYEKAEYIHCQVIEPVTDLDTEGKPQFTTYLIQTETTFPEYSSNSFSVRRRYRYTISMIYSLSYKLVSSFG
jgi:hypothetical protein